MARKMISAAQIRAARALLDISQARTFKISLGERDDHQTA